MERKSRKNDKGTDREEERPKGDNLTLNET